MTFLIHHHVIKAYWMCGGIAPRILDLSTRWMWVVMSLMDSFRYYLYMSCL